MILHVLANAHVYETLHCVLAKKACVYVSATFGTIGISRMSLISL